MLLIIGHTDIESILREHPDVKDGAVIPFYDQSLASNVPQALGMLNTVSMPGSTHAYYSSVVLSSAAKGDPNIEEDIVKWVAERVPDYQQLRGGVCVLDVIPRGRTGKVLRTLLKGKNRFNDSMWSAYDLN